MVNQPVLYQASETLRGIDILRRRTTDFNGSQMPVFHPTIEISLTNEERAALHKSAGAAQELIDVLGI